MKRNAEVAQDLEERYFDGAMQNCMDNLINTMQAEFILCDILWLSPCIRDQYPRNYTGKAYEFHLTHEHLQHLKRNSRTMDEMLIDKSSEKQQPITVIYALQKVTISMGNVHPLLTF